MDQTTRSNRFTYSAISTFLNCRRKYWYRYIRCLEQKDRPVWFATGTAIHMALEHWYNGMSVDEVQRIIADYFTDTHPETDDAERQKEWQEQYELAAKMFANYVQQYPQEQFKVLATEVEFDLKVGKVLLSGKIDALIEYNGKLWLMEHKTARYINYDYRKKLSMDLQNTLYTWAMSKWQGQPIAGVLYNVLAKDFPKKPEVLKSGKLSTAKSQSTTPELYRAAIKENGLREDDYLEYLNWLEGNQKDYFYREWLPIGKDEQANVLSEIKKVIRDARAKSACYYRNTAQCHSFGQCGYWDACVSPDPEGVLEVGYVTTAAHPELSQGDTQLF